MYRGRLCHWGAILLCSAGAYSELHGDVVLQTDALRLAVNETGKVGTLSDRAGQVDYLARGQECALLRLRVDGRFVTPSKMRWDADKKTMHLLFEPVGVEAKVRAAVKPTHVVLELVEVTPGGKADVVQWGPLPTTIKETVGEIVGVVRNGDFAIGLLGLNPKTQGGFFPNEEGRDTTRGQAARAAAWGSTLQAWSLDRTRLRKISVWGENFPNMPVLPIKGETLVGSKIALFGCAASQALARIGQIQQAEGLPHPVFDGTWVKRSREAGRPYLIASFSERTIDEMLRYTKRGNLATLYHPGPFKSWGHFELKRGFFPHGVKGLKACVAKARKLGIRIGAHTLTNFINTNDPYVTPVPDKRLARTGSSRLVADVDADAKEIPVASREYFDNKKANWLRTVTIGQELIRYGPVSEGNPPKLRECQRGAFGTKATPHKKGDEVAKLLDHPYKVFFPNYEMQHEIAVHLAKLFNESGMTHMDFDGHEGCWASGHGDFAVEMFAKVFYDHLERPVYNGSSVSKHFYWHINTALNWGEPWYAGFRASQADYRFNNQPLLARNYLPQMLGWFAMRRETTLADIEWMLARCAGYDAGFALASDIRALQKNPQTGQILDAIREWEHARQAAAFSEEQRKRLRDPAREFHLAKTADGTWQLYPYRLSKPFVYEARVRQPGEPTAAQWEVVNPDATQQLSFQLSVEGDQGSVRDVALEIDRHARVDIPAEIKPGQMLVCDGSQTVRIYDAKGQQAKALELKRPAPPLSQGGHQIELSGEFSGDPPPRLLVRFRTRGRPERLQQR